MATNRRISVLLRSAPVFALFCAVFVRFLRKMRKINRPFGERLGRWLGETRGSYMKGKCGELTTTVAWGFLLDSVSIFILFGRGESEMLVWALARRG